MPQTWQDAEGKIWTLSTGLEIEGRKQHSCGRPQEKDPASQAGLRWPSQPPSTTDPCMAQQQT